MPWYARAGGAIGAREGGIVEEGQEQNGTGGPVTERARIAGVEAGIAAGLVPPAQEAAHPDSESVDPAYGSVKTNDSQETSDSPAPSPASPPYELPDWTDPPTLQLPRVLLDLEQDAVVEQGGQRPLPPGGPVWRERQEDWNETDTILADLASSGPSVTDYEESSSEDPFSYDFLDIVEESSWITRDDAADSAKAVARTADTPSQVDEQAPPPAPAPEAVVAEEAIPADSTPERGSGEVVSSSVERGRQRHRRPRASRPRRSAPVAKTGDGTASRNPVVATITGVALAAILLLCFMAGPPAVLAVAVVAVTLAASELFSSLRLAGYRPATLLGIIAVPGVIIAAYFRGPSAILEGFVIFMVLAMIWYLAGITRRSPVTNLSVTVFAFGWVGVLAAYAGLLVDPRIFPHRHGIAFMLGAVIAAVGYDVGGYVIGSRFGRHSLAPSVSPKKTWEGLAGGCVVAIAASVGITARIHPWSVGTALVLGLIVAVVAPCGDLVESMVKRNIGVKDMGSLLPGHGGMMDRIDALLFVLPAAYYFVRLAHI